MRRSWCWTLAAVMALVAAGCGSSGDAAKETGTGSEAAPEAIKRRDAAELPPVGDYLPPLDDGRVEIAPPKGWKTLGRMPNYLVNFNRGKTSNDFPRISITASDAATGAEDVTEANAYAFAAEMAKQLKQEGKKAIAEPPKPIILGDRVWSRYVRNPFYGGDPIAIQMLQTIQNGRQYNIELIINVQDSENYASDLEEPRDAAYSVAAHMKFVAQP